MSKYSIKVDKVNKKMDMVIKGSFNQEDVQNFVKDYKGYTNAMNCKDFNLEVDCKYMDLLTKEMVPSLENSFRLYKETGFNKVTFYINKNAILKMQLNRIARSAGLTNSEVVED